MAKEKIYQSLKAHQLQSLEISSSAFARTFTLLDSVDSTKAAALLKDGMLEITLPKAESSKKRNIEVK